MAGLIKGLTEFGVFFAPAVPFVGETVLQRMDTSQLSD